MRNYESKIENLRMVIRNARSMAEGGNIPRREINDWVSGVGMRLRDLPGGMALQAEWEAIPDRDREMDDPETRDGFVGLWGLNKRLSWLQQKMGELAAANAEEQRRQQERAQAKEIAQALDGARRETKEEATPKTRCDPRIVFVVHGRNLALRDSMFAFLRAIGLHPLEWSEAIRATGKTLPYVGEILEAAFSRAQAVVVLMTPDDEARLREEFLSEGDMEHERELTPQARPNVLFEAGMAMGRFADRTVLVEIGKLRPFSDVGGRHVIRMDGTGPRRQELAHRLRDAGCAVSLEGTDWHTAGTLAAPGLEGGEQG